jgi:hypothetical protein
VEFSKNNKYSRAELDNNYEDLIHDKFLVLNKKFSKEEFNLISIDTLKIMSTFLREHKPKSVARKYKTNLINYIDFFIEDPKRTKNKTNCVLKKKELLVPIVDFMTKFGFVLKNSWFSISLIFLLIDIVIISFSKIYSVPCLFIIFSIVNYLIDFYSKKKGKLLTIW